MKFLLTLISVFSLSFSGFYVSYDLMHNVEFSSSFGSADDDASGALAIGYEEALDNNNISLGISYDLIMSEFDASSDFGASNDGNGFLNLYGKYLFPINEKLNFWGSLGYNLPQGDLADEDADAGLSYGFGVSMSNGIGVSYSFNNSSFEDVDVVFSRFAISYSF